MKIESVVLTEAEMNQAVQEFLKWRNMDVKVVDVDKVGYGSRTRWEVSLECKLDTDPEAVAEPAPIPEPVTVTGSATTTTSPEF